MLVKRGIPVSPGVVTGPALVLGTEDFRIPQRFVSVDVVDSEVSRFQASLEAVCDEIAQNEQLASEQLGKPYRAIFAAHLQMARDPQLIEEIEGLIRNQCHSPEFASSRVLRRYAKRVQALGNHYLAERAFDIYDLEKRILRHLLGERREELNHLTAPVIVLADNLTPGEVARLDAEFVLGFATEIGGPTSHTAILAGARELPAIVGVGPFLSDVSGGDTIVLDATRGEVIADPDEATLQKYRDDEAKFRSVTEKLASLHSVISETEDGVPIHLMGNIEFPEELGHCTQRGAEGIGLYRTEFLYLETDREPTEEDHYAAYRRVISAFPSQPVVIRTLDLGADKIPGCQQDFMRGVANPVLGLRSIRLSLRNLALFKTQLRAILRAATEGDVRIMFPLIGSLLELRQTRMVLSDVMDDLDDEGIPFKRDIPVGMMVEVPAAAVMAEEFAREVDFFSIGTNDLIQYTLAVDRADQTVADLYRSGDPSILRLIRTVVTAADNQQIPVTVCGQMSSDPMYLPLLVGMGMRQLSVTPHTIPELKQVVRSLTIPQAQEIAERAQSLDIARDVENYLRDELKRLCPDLVM